MLVGVFDLPLIVNYGVFGKFLESITLYRSSLQKRFENMAIMSYTVKWVFF